MILTLGLGAGCLDTLAPVADSGGNDLSGPPPGDDPPDVTPPPDDDPPPDVTPPPDDNPPPPLPPPSPGDDMSQVCAQVGHGYSVSEFWRDWCVRDSSGGPCGLRWCDGPGDPPAYGIMWRNTQGATALPSELRRKGWVEFEFFFDTDTEPNNYGGKHLFCISSSFFNTDLGPGGYARGWCRPDVGLSDGKARLSFYSADGDGNVLDNHQVWVTNASVAATQRWVRLKYAWDRYAPDKLRITFNDSESRTLTIHPECKDPGQYLYFGNMDRTGGQPLENNMDGNSQIRYRNIRWGN
jgi:hypothetical protein